MSNDYIFDTTSSTSVQQGGNPTMDFFPSNYDDSMQDDYEHPPDYSEAIGDDSYEPVFNREGQLASIWTGAYADEKPLLEELGVNLHHIMSKTQAVLHPTKEINPHIMDDTDLAGPVVICLLLGVSLLLRGKLQFGYIYGFGLIGCLSIWFFLNLMSERGMDIARVVSVLGYCLLPMVVIALLSVVFPLRGTAGLVLAALSTFWCTKSASKMFVAVLHMVEQRGLVAFPVGLIYACFALMAVF